jgi:nifR3 family TIM-barrel protein
MRIGNVELETNLLLSPIAGYTDLAFRETIRPLGGLGLAFTELLNPAGIRHGTRRSRQIAETDASDRPLAVQLYGTNPAELAEGAQWATEHGAAIVDINMGCPVPKVAGKGGGSGLLRTCPLAVELAARVVAAVPVPVTVKTRLGWEIGNLTAPALARELEEAGVAGLTIHGRYGEQRFNGRVDLDGIRAVVAAVRRIPVFGNGDVRSPADARRMIDQTGCAGVMIGRWALGDHWIFRDAYALLTTGVIPPPPSRGERVRQMIWHFRTMVRRLGEHFAVLRVRKFMAHYAKTIGPCPKLRRAVPLVASAAEFYDLFGEFLDQLHRSGLAERQGETAAA